MPQEEGDTQRRQGHHSECQPVQHVSRKLSLVVFESDDQALARLGREDRSLLADGDVFVVSILHDGGCEVEVSKLLGSNNKLKF